MLRWLLLFTSLFCSEKELAPNGTWSALCYVSQISGHEHLPNFTVLVT